MIKYPLLKELPAARQMVDTFRGYNHNLKIGAGEFYEMENMTSDDYPVLSVRQRRGRVISIQDGGSATGGLYVPGKGLFFTFNVQNPPYGEEGELHLLTPEGETKWVSNNFSLSQGRKSMALMGKTLVIAPDMVCVDVQSLKCSKMEYRQALAPGRLYFQNCREDGTFYTPAQASSTEPTAPRDGDFWQDVSVSPPVLKQYSAIQQSWFQVNPTSTRIWGLPLENHRFYVGDCITISGLGKKEGVVTDTEVAMLNGSHIITAVDFDCITVSGSIYGAKTWDLEGDLTAVGFERTVPRLDFVVESGNRLWGCSSQTNELYACKLGDHRNWYSFQGLSTDSWVAGVGTPGDFTGAIVQKGYPVFYKEDCKHKVWPSSTGDHQVTATDCNGVEKGSAGSLAVFGGMVFYKSPLGVCVDDGSGPVEIGGCLGSVTYHSACGAVHDQKYYLEMQDGEGKRHLFVYDLAKKLWHREKGTHSGCIASGGGSVYAAADGELLDLTGKTGTPEEAVSWMVQTGELGMESPDQKYLSRLTLRMALEPGATMEIYAQYDREPVWVRLGQVYGTDLRSFSLPIRPRRCDQLRLKLQGKGMCRIYSLTKTIQKGSELP